MKSFNEWPLSVKITSLNFVAMLVVGSIFGLLITGLLSEEALKIGNELLWDTIIMITGITVAQSLFIFFIVRIIIARPIDDASSLLKIIAKGDLATPLYDAPGDEISAMYNSFHLMQEKLTKVITGIRFGSQEVSGAASQVSQGNSDLSQRTQEQASSLEQIASSMEEMMGTVTQNSENSSHAKQLAIDARSEVQHGHKVVMQAIEAMNKINDYSNQVSDIISVINEIASQTNLLALNAAVEAAHAGEHGRGFAVVASEIRNLSARSAEAAKEIKALIQDSVQSVQTGTQLTDESGQALQKILESVQGVSNANSEIAAASHEQSSGLAQINNALTQMDEMTQQNAALVEEAAAVSEAMGSQAEDLAHLVSYFKLSKERERSEKTAYQTEHAKESKNAVQDDRQAPMLSEPVASVSPAMAHGDDGWKEF